MRHTVLHYLAAAVVVLVLPATPVLARGRTVDSRGGMHRRHRDDLASVHHHRLAYHYRRRHGYSVAEQQQFGEWSGGQFQSAFGAPIQRPQQASGRSSEYEGLVAQQASANGVPVSLVHRVIMRESGYNPRAVSRGNYGMMQIRLGTARAMGYSGSAAGLLDAETNMTYAVRYLAGAYRAAGGDENRAVALYARGYYPQAKAQGFSPYAEEAAANTQPENNFAGKYRANGTVAWSAPFGDQPGAYGERHYRHHPA